MCTVGGAKFNEFCIDTVTSASWAKASSTGTSKQTTASAAPKTRKHNQWEPDMVEHSTPFRLPNVKATAPLQSESGGLRSTSLMQFSVTLAMKPRSGGPH